MRANKNRDSKKIKLQDATKFNCTLDAYLYNPEINSMISTMSFLKHFEGWILNRIVIDKSSEKFNCCDTICTCGAKVSGLLCVRDTFMKDIIRFYYDGYAIWY